MELILHPDYCDSRPTVQQGRKKYIDKTQADPVNSHNKKKPIV